MNRGATSFGKDCAVFGRRRAGEAREFWESRSEWMKGAAPSFGKDCAVLGRSRAGEFREFREAYSEWMNGAAASFGKAAGAFEGETPEKGRRAGRLHLPTNHSNRHESLQPSGFVLLQ